MLGEAQQMLGIYDKGKKDSTFIRNVDKYAGQKSIVYTKLKDFQDVEIAITHIFDEDWITLIDKYSCPNSVRVRVSTAGFPDASLPTTTDNGVYVLYLVPSIDDLAVEWQEMLHCLSDKAIVASLVRGENPRGLKRFFLQDKQDYLSALTILCEGYLAVHAEHPNYHADIRPALDIMKWSEFRKSERGQALTRQNLTEKISRVQQPEWWLKIFGEESFYKRVKQEWESTTKGEMPKVLNALLKTILNGEAIVPPKIVANAYCVLKRKTRITITSQWQTQRNKLNHDWWKNEFFNSFDDFIVELKKTKPAATCVSDFLAKDFPAWKTRRQDAQWIVESFEDSMTPRRLLESSPLNRCDDETHAWLGNLVHGLWLTRYPVKRKVQESRDALAAVNRMYEKITRELEQARPIELTKLIALRPQFCRLIETYRSFSQTLSNLPR